MENQSLNDDIIVEIFSWLPAKSILMFETIGKGWHKIICDNTFRRHQCQREKITISGFFMQDMIDLSKQVKYLPFITTGATVRLNLWNFPVDKIEIAASSNGLLCCQTPISSCIYVCNPATKEHVQIEWPKGGEYCRNFALAVDPFCNPMDTFSNFKLVSVHRSGPRSFSFQMYSSKTKQWRKLDHDLDNGYRDRLLAEAVFASGVLYWMTRNYGIFALDVETEQPYSLPFPVQWDEQVEGHYRKCIGESEGRLHFILMYIGSLQVWCLDTEMKWELKQLVSLSAMEEQYPHFLYSKANVASCLVPKGTTGSLMAPWIEPLAFKDGIVLLKLRCSFSCDYGLKLVEACTKLYLYHTGNTKPLEEVCTFEESESTFRFGFHLKVVPYSMTLAPLEST